jgi:hypothetical protein
VDRANPYFRRKAKRHKTVVMIILVNCVMSKSSNSKPATMSSSTTKDDEAKAFYVTAGAAQWKERLITKEDVRRACVYVAEFL